MYQALYRKWRPNTFDEVVGQNHITDILKNQVKSGRLSHAYIFIGTRGTGKTTCARILSRAVNCENPVNGNPCGRCAACRGILAGEVMDVVELDAASNNGVDNVRALREEAVFSPAQVKKRVYIIDEVHMLSTAAFNALLKILEEPPEHLMFILATTELQKVPATILSRCQRHSFKRIEATEIARYLQYIAQQEHFSITEDAANLIARLAEGGVRDALSLLDQCSAYETIDIDAVYSAMGLAGNRRIAALWDAVLRKDTPKALQEFKTLWMDGKDPVSLLNELAGLMRDVMIMRVAPNTGLELISGGHDVAVLKNFLGRMTIEEILSVMDTLQNAVLSMRTSPNPKMTAELCIVELCDCTQAESVKALRARISRLEAQLANGSYVPVAQADLMPVYSGTPALSEQKCMPAEFAVPVPAQRSESPVMPHPVSQQIPQQSREVPNAVQASNQNPENNSGGDIPALIEKVKGTVNRLARTILSKPENFVIKLTDEQTLYIEAQTGSNLDTLKRPEVVQAFANAANELRLQVREVIVREFTAENKPVRNIMDITQFPEVTVINK